MKTIIENKAKLTYILGISIIIIICGGMIMYNNSIKKINLRPLGGTEFAHAVVEEIITSDINESPEGELSGQQLVKVKITSGKYKNTEVEASSPYANNSGARCYKDLKVIVLLNENDSGDLIASVYNYDRGMTLCILIGLFIAVLCIIGGKKGLASAVGLIFTFLCIFALYLPLMYTGTSPFIAATLTCIIITIVVMMLIGGMSYKTLCSITGTIGGVLLAGAIAAIFGKLSHISGLNVDNVETLSYVAQNSKLDVGGVLFSGILIASLGAVMDVSMSVSSTISEILATNPTITRKRLFQAGINVGKDMMGTMSNTLILAFAGSSINSLIIIYAYSMPYAEYMNRYDIGIELLRGISGSLGVILTVPFVSFISAFLMTKKFHEK